MIFLVDIIKRQEFLRTQVELVARIATIKNSRLHSNSVLIRIQVSMNNDTKYICSVGRRAHDRQVVLVQRHCHQQHQLSGLLGYASLLFLPGLPVLSRLSLDVFGSELLALPVFAVSRRQKEQEARAGTAELVAGTGSGSRSVVISADTVDGGRF